MYLKNLIALALAAVLMACTGGADDEAPTSQVIRMGVLPDQSTDFLIAKYSPLVDHLARQTGLEFELVISDGYSAMLDDFRTGRVDVANFGGLTFIQAERQYNAQPLVMRDTDLNFVSCYLVTATDDRQSLTDFEGESFSFGPELSTSGHLMPRYFLKLQGIDPETYFASSRHSSGHEETALWVRDGTVGLGVANCMVIQAMDADGRLGKDDVRVLETTPAYADYVWAVQEGMDAATRIVLTDAFLALDAVDPEHQAILRKLGASAYLPARPSDFDEVRRAARDPRFVEMLGFE